MREIVMGLIGVLLAYMLWLVLRWMRLSRANRRKPTLFREPALSATPETLLPEDPDPLRTSRDLHDDAADDAEDDDHVELYAKPRPPAEPDASAFGFDALLEMRQTRHLTDALSREVETLKHEVAQLRQDLTDLRAASRVSPQYGEAVSLARRGLDAQAIAERCGISVSEAELVRSLLALSPSEPSGD